MKTLTKDKKLGLLLLLIQLLVINCYAQLYPNGGPYVNMTINNEQIHMDNMKGRDDVTLLPGATIKNDSRIYLDPSIQAPVTYSSNPNAGFGNTTPELDKDLDVGTIPGQASVNLMGGACYTIPFDFPKGSGGVIPQISLTYNSGGGMGIAGLGWNLNGLHAISRSGRNMGDDGRVTSISMSNDDWFVFDGSKLIPETENGLDEMRYHTQVESFSKIISHTSNIEKGPDWWEIITKDGTKIEIGKNIDSRVMSEYSKYVANPDYDANLPSWVPDNPEKIWVLVETNLMWMVNKITDRSGNYITFEYDNHDNKEIVLKKIKYAGNTLSNINPDCEINIYYSLSNNIDYYNIDKANIQRSLIIRQIESKINGVRYNKYNFEYKSSFLWEFLTSVQIENKDGKKFNKTEFNYEQDFLEDNAVTLKKETGSTYFSLSDDGDHVISLDFNGDGLKDIVSVKSTNATFFSWKLYKNLGDGLFKEVDDYIFPGTIPGYINPSSSIGFMNNKNLIKQIVDFDGNGLEDFYIQINFDIVTGSVAIRHSIGYVFTSNGNTMDASVRFGPEAYDPATTQFNTFLADMNGDTRTDLVIHKQINVQNSTPPVGNHFLVKDIANNVEYGPLINYNNFDFSKALAIYRGAEGKQSIDGISESLTVGNNTTDLYYQLKLQGNNLVIFGSEKFSFDDCSAANPVFNYLGDFNGDGNTDKLIYFNNNWVQATLFEDSYTSSSITPNILGPHICSHHIYTADVTADGKSDVIQIFESGSDIMCTVSYLVNGQWVTVNTPGMGNTVNLGSFTNFMFESVNFLDVDGDGTNDLIFKAINNNTPYWYVHYFKRSINNCFLKSVRDGIGKKSNFIYDLASKGIVDRDPLANYSYPNNIIGMSGKFVKTLENDNGLGGFFQQSFQYKNAVINRHGKGFLGYQNTIIIDLGNDVKSITNNVLVYNSGTAANIAMLMPENSFVKTLADVNLNSATYSFNAQPTIISTYNNVLPNNQNINRSTFLLKAIGSETNNHITGATSSTTNVTNDDGNVTSTTININNGLQINTTTIEYDDDPNHQFTVPYLPEKVTKTSTRGGGTNTAVTDYAYNNNHELETETNNDPEPNNNTNYTNTITYEYNSGGSLKKEIASNSVTSNTKEYFYDPKFRNLVKELNTLGQESNYTYDPLGNTLLSTKDITNLVTSAEYDGWFRSVKTSSPNGVVAESKYEWADANEISGSHPTAITSNLQYIVYKVTSTLSGAPTSITYYDVLGRAIFSASESITNTQYSGAIYNDKGKVFKEVGAYQNASDDPVMITKYTYSNLDRKVESNILAGSMVLNSSTEETGYNAGTTEVTITKADGKTEKRYTDASGKLVKVIDNQGLAIEYEYNNITTGNKNEIITKVGGAIATHAIFDEAGNQISLFDKQAGETTYEYDGAGQMTKQTDPTGNVYTFTYKPDGRMLTKLGDEGTYTYIYEETSNNGKNKLKELQGPNGSIKYYYNNLQRLIKQEEIYTWDTYTTNYEYDMYGHQTKYTYPNGFAVKSIYDSKGYLTKMERADNGNLIWQLNETNFADAITKYEYGNGVQVNNIYNDLGRLIETQIPNVIDYIRYGIHLQSGNTTSRSMKLPYTNIAAFVESFTFNEDRLESHTYDRTNAPIISTNYDNFGKIKDKTDVGTLYTYNGRNRLQEIENPESNISHNEQNIVFNSFKRPQNISEGNYELTYTYGPDQERIKGEWKDNGASKKNRYYASNFEINEIVGGSKHEICYISSPNGLCAMYVKDVNAGVGSLHYTYTDNLGSILAITDENGAIEARQNFDAWGRRRHAITYEYLDQNTPDIHNGLPGLNSTGNLPPWLYRGYTGHEMLDEFTLINMNARLYDPVVGMMLSCDNYVQDPSNAQNYNRYSYCYNNPLKYTDPTGNFAVFDDVVAMTIGAGFGAWQGYRIGAAKGAEGWNMAAYIAGGALIGAAAGEAALYTGGAAAGLFATGANAILVGATVGAVGGATAGFINGAGMAYMGGANVTDGLLAGGKGAILGAATGALMGGAMGAFSTTSAGKSFGKWRSQFSKGRFFDRTNPYLQSGGDKNNWKDKVVKGEAKTKLDRKLDVKEFAINENSEMKIRNINKPDTYTIYNKEGVKIETFEDIVTSGPNAYPGSKRGVYTYSFKEAYNKGLIIDNYIKVTVMPGEITYTFWEYTITNTVFWQSYIPPTRVKFK